MKSPEDYNLEKLEPVFLRNGVTKLHLNSWFMNYETKSELQKDALERVRAAYLSKRPIIMIGKFGTGKTHLAMTVVKNTMINREGAAYYTLTGLYRGYRSTFGDGETSESSFFKKLSGLSMLAIDEINIRSDSEAENRFLQEIMDDRYSNNLPTILIGNLTLSEFSEVVGERIVDRLKEQGAEVIVFNWGSHRGKK